MFSFFVSKINKKLLQHYPLLVLFIILILSIATISSFATPVNVTFSSSQERLGILMRSYFENANAPLSGSSPSADTGITMPASSGSYVIPSGASAYLWTPQFSTTTLIPSGTMTLDLWAGPTPELDGKNSSGFNAVSGSIMLTTTKTNDLIYVLVAVKGSQTASISGAGLTWASRGLSSRSEGRVYAFTAVSSGALFGCFYHSNSERVSDVCYNSFWGKRRKYGLPV